MIHRRWEYVLHQEKASKDVEGGEAGVQTPEKVSKYTVKGADRRKPSE